jgi:hypothetical protein
MKGQKKTPANRKMFWEKSCFYQNQNQTEFPIHRQTKEQNKSGNSHNRISKI